MTRLGKGDINLLIYSSQYVRDLAWMLCGAANLMQLKNDYQKIMADDDWLLKLDKNPQPLIDYLNSRNLRMLGTYFESLWVYFLENYPQRQLIAKNIQVFANDSAGIRQTLGEFDFIYTDTTSGECYHLEVAIKYYLGVVDEAAELSTRSNQYSPIESWIGPGINDRLDKKFYKLVNQQSKLSESVAGKKELARLGVSSVSSEICLLGYLFYPYSKTQEATLINEPESAASGHPRGCWVTLSQLMSKLGEAELWAIRDKPHWLSPVIFERRELFYSAELCDIIKDHFNHSRFPVLISSFFSQYGDNCSDYLSGELVFVVPDDWETTAISLQ